MFVPGNNERMIRKASQLSPDSVIVDLEDAVPENQKEEARRLILNLLPNLDWGGKELCVRINPLYSPHFYRDIVLVSGLDVVDCIVVPKAEGDLGFLHKATGKKLEPMVETPRGFLRIEDIVRSEGVVAVTYGLGDLAHYLGGKVEAYEGNDYVRTAIVMAARAYGVDPVDRVFFDVRNLDAFRKDCIEAKAMGFVGKQVIHPDQVVIANEVFSPSPEELEWARRVVEAYERAVKEGRGAIELNGELIDAMHYRMAKDLLSKFGSPTHTKDKSSSMNSQ